jgi:hypothetical protein
MLADLESWLKNTIPGIICLGALGSIIAVILLKCANYFFNFQILLHRNKSIKQAYMLGYAAALINKAAITVLLLSSVIFIALLATQSGITLTIGGAISTGIGFTAIYLIYFEFEYVYRTYLFFWKGPLKQAEEAYSKSHNRQRRD